MTKMSALAGLFLNTKDKGILSRFGDLRPIFLKHGGTFRNFLRYHNTVFSITEDPCMPGPGDCIVDVRVRSKEPNNNSVDVVSVRADKSALTALPLNVNFA